MRYKEFLDVFKELSPMEVFNILTRGKYPGMVKEDSHWDDLYNFRSNQIVINRTGINIYTTEEKSKEIQSELKSWNLFNNVWERWDIDGNSVGFYYNLNNFEILYKEYIRNKKILNILS